jgi:hypothetical protein
MECYRRAMVNEQTFESRRENLSQANKLSRTYAVLLDALNRHRGKGQQKVTVEHVHVHSGGQAIVGTVETPTATTITNRFTQIGEHTRCDNNNCLCTAAHDAEPKLEIAPRAKRQRCRTADVGCTAECRREHRREIRTPSNTGATPRRRSHDVARFQRWCVPAKRLRGSIEQDPSELRLERSAAKTGYY